MIPCCRPAAWAVRANTRTGARIQMAASKLEFINFYGVRTMKQLFTFQGFPMGVVVALVVWSWISILSVLIAAFFGPGCPKTTKPRNAGLCRFGGYVCL